MSLLHEIQTAVTQEGTDIAPILLKLRLLASRLGSAPLEEWVKHESEGYPDDVPLPPYRRVSVSYLASFVGTFGSRINQIPIPPQTIRHLVSDEWNFSDLRQSISAIDDMVKRGAAAGEAALSFGASSLVPILGDKVYEDHNCVMCIKQMSRSALVGLQHIVRSRILELTIKIEGSIPDSTKIESGLPAQPIALSAEKVNQITNQVFYPGATNIQSSGTGALFNVAIQQGNQQSLVEALVNAGIAQADAAEFGLIVASEKPESKDEPFGAKAKKWVVDNLKKATSGAWNMGVSVATDVLKAAVMKYYGL
jgi:hypothetical protein